MISEKQQYLYDTAINAIGQMDGYMFKKIVVFLRTPRHAAKKPLPNYPFDVVKIGEALKKLRLAKGLSQLDVNKGSGVSTSVLSMIEKAKRGSNINPDIYRRNVDIIVNFISKGEFTFEDLNNGKKIEF